MAATQLDSLRPTVLYLDSEACNQQAFQDAFLKDFTILMADDLDEAIGLLATQEVHVVISNQNMDDMTGSQALALIKERFPAVRRMLITAHADLHALVDALNMAGVCHYIEKPWEAAEVRTAVVRAWQEYRKEREVEEYTEKLVESNRQLEFALRQSLLS